MDGPVLGIYVHGLFEQPGILGALFGASPRRSLEQAFDELADATEKHVDVATLLREACAA
jgi:adenosylcobyric acid synthase